MSNKAKTLELQEQQKELRKVKSTKEILKLQQRALRQGLLLDKPFPEKKAQKTRRLKEEQRILKDVGLQRKRAKEKEKEILKKLRENEKERTSRISNLFSIGTFNKKKRMRL